MKNDSPEEALRRALADLEQTVNASESARLHLERRLRRAAFWPDRRTPRRWSGCDPSAPGKHEEE